MNWIKYAVQKLGHIALTIGLCVFGIAFFSMVTNQGPGSMTIDSMGIEGLGDQLPNNTRGQDLAYLFRGSGFFIGSGWLMLRFAAGLFPFSRRLFQ